VLLYFWYGERRIVKIGVLALQGAFIEHVQVFERMGVPASEIRLPADLAGVDGIVIPGGESTTMLNLMETYDLLAPLKEAIQSGLPVLGTCAGMICLARKVANTNACPKPNLAVMDIEVQRNAFGRQVDSFEVELPVPVLGAKPFPAVFIRAPLIEKASSLAEVLARLPDGVIVAARQKNMLVTSFHPELTSDTRLHQYFLKMAGG
jgi:pyridoxal 5'-phosphate synthase pdxT subunit